MLEQDLAEVPDGDREVVCRGDRHAGGPHEPVVDQLCGAATICVGGAVLLVVAGEKVAAALGSEDFGWVGVLVVAVPAIWVLEAFAWTPFEMVLDENATIWTAMGRSWDIVRGFRMNLIATFLLVPAILSCGSLLLGVGLFVAQALVDLLFAPMFLAQRTGSRAPPIAWRRSPPPQAWSRSAADAAGNP